MFLEKILIYGAVFLIGVLVFLIYFLKLKREEKKSEVKIKIAHSEGTYEPVSIHPVVDFNRCIKSGACIEACPEKDVLGIRNGKAYPINASHCIGHGACVRACPVEAISLYIGTAKRGVDLPDVNQNFETNVSGLFVAGELGGMGLIKNAVTQGREAVENIAKSIKKNTDATYDLIVVGAGPAGISATLTAKKMGLKCLTLEQDTLGGTVYTFPRSKIVMTSPMDLPLYGKVKLYETSKKELLDLWNAVLSKNKISIKENSRVEAITPRKDSFLVETIQGETFTAEKIVLAIGRRGTPTKLLIPGEMSEKVAYRLLEPEIIVGKNICVVGGGDSAIESALLLAEQNKVTLSYRKDSFSRIKQKNRESIKEAIDKGLIDMKFNSQLISIESGIVSYKYIDKEEIYQIENDLVYIFAGGELPTAFLKKMGINITTKYGEALLNR